MDKLPQSDRQRAGARDEQGSRPHQNVRGRSESIYRPSITRHKRNRVAYIDDIVTYVNIGLVTMTTESKPPGVHWWNLAFQLAKEYKLNHDPDLTAPPGRLVDHQIEFPGKTPETHDHASATTETASSVTSPMIVDDDAIVESSDPRPVFLSFEESEERRRIWWTLYIFDR